MQWLVSSYEIRKQSKWIALHEEDDFSLKSGPVIIMRESIPPRNQEARRMSKGKYSKTQRQVPSYEVIKQEG